ncbi:MAG TPA: PQQ-binding-like beta-propeller repeat protein [Candidatus Acidoferrum sp.]|nr:PQQ-binding-like beta-propeller repeat protein [Candidatus Acidoferrum sp.]
MKPLLTCLSLLACLNLVATSASWPQFRGPNSSGVAEKGTPPIVFGKETNLLWKIAVPSGLSSPCIAGDLLFLTAFEDGKLLGVCFDRRNGKELWRAEAPPGKSQDVHQVSSPAVATPATDGKLVFMYFVPFGIVAYDFNGKEQWRKALPFEFVMNGSGTSPAISGDALVLNCDQDEGESFVIVLESRTGKTRWQASRHGGGGSYSTPIVWKRGRQEDVVVAGSFRVAGYDVHTGKERWTANVLTSVSVAPTPVIGDGQIFVMSRGVPPTAMGTFAGFADKSDKDKDGKISPDEAPRGFQGGTFRGMDRDKDGFITEKDWSAMTNLFAKGDSGLFALRAPGEGDITATHVAWKKTRGVAGISSPLFYEGRVYAVQDGGRLTCWNAKSGTPHYEQERLGADGEYYASPIAANGHVYFASSKGVITAVRSDDALEVESRNTLGESLMSTPAIAGDALYVRSAKHLWAFGKK